MKDSRKMSEAGEGQLLTTKEAAAILNVQPHTLVAWRHYKSLDLSFVKMGHLVRYRREDVQCFIENRTQQGG